jgi:MFS family permease
MRAMLVTGETLTDIPPAVIPAPRPSPHPLVPFALLEAATVASGAGNGVASVAIPWLILERTGNPAAAGVVGVATALPLLASSLFSGAVIDTLGKRRTSVLSDICSAISVAAIPLVDLLLGLNLGLIVVLAAVGAVFDPAGATARQTMLPEVASRGRIRLERANGIHEAAWATAYVVGPGIGGLLVAVVGAAGALWATSAAFLVSILAISLVRSPGLGRPAPHERPESLLRGSGEGVAYVWRHRLLRTMGIIMMVLVAVYMPLEGVVLPVIFEAQQAPGRLGGVLMALSAGGIVGSLLYGALSQRIRRYRLFVTTLILASLSILGMSVIPSYPLLIGASALAGLFWGPMGPLLNLEMQIQTPPRMRGRVFGVLSAIEYGAGPVGYLLVGWLVARFGAEPVFVAIGVLITVAAVVSSLSPSLRLLDETGPYEAELTLVEIHPPV